MQTDAPDLLAGLDEIKLDYGESHEEAAVRVALIEIAEKNPLVGSRIALARMCLSLAQNVAAGNRKGRAVANEVATLASLMEQLDPTVEDHDDLNLSPELRRIIDALATPPTVGGTSAVDATES